MTNNIPERSTPTAQQLQLSKVTMLLFWTFVPRIVCLWLPSPWTMLEDVLRFALLIWLSRIEPRFRTAAVLDIAAFAVSRVLLLLPDAQWHGICNIVLGLVADFWLFSVYSRITKDVDPDLSEKWSNERYMYVAAHLFNHFAIVLFTEFPKLPNLIMIGAMLLYYYAEITIFSCYLKTARALRAGPKEE